MTTRFRTSVSLAILGALALTAGAYAKEGNVGEMVRAAREDNGQREGNARQAPERRAERAVERAAERSERSAVREQRQAPAPQVQRERPRDADRGESRQFQRFADRLPRNAPAQQANPPPPSPPVLAAAPQQQNGRDRGARNGGGDRGAPGNISRGERNERGTVGNVVREADRNAQNRDRGNWNGDRNWNRGDNDGRRYQGNRRPPRFVNTLPGGYRQYHWNGRPYYHYGGSWYRPYGTRYIVVGAPYGLFVSYLPSYYNSFWFGSTRYYYVDDTYYIYEPARRGYVVTRSPYVTEADDEYYDEELDQDLYIYPTRGQSEQQQADDRYECHAWAVDQTGYDPIESDYDADRRADYLRAMTACLTGRGYSVK